MDTKLARSAKPAHLLQLLLLRDPAREDLREAPEHLHVELGTGERESFRTEGARARYAAPSKEPGR